MPDPRPSDQLTAAVGALIDPVRRRILRDDGTADWATAPSRLDQLADAVATGLERGGVRSGGPGTPIDLDAWTLLATIQAGVAARTVMAGLALRDDTASALRQLAATARGWGDGDAVTELADLVAGWAGRAEHLLDGTGQARYVRGQDCPACHARRVTVAGIAGPVETPALLLRTRDGQITGAACQSCGAWWAWGAALEQLGAAHVPDTRPRAGSAGNGW